jgi:putative transposase
MPRAARVLKDHSRYHILTRGNNNQTVFHDEHDFTRYLDMLAKYAKTRHFFLYHFVLMPSHVHLIVETIQAGKLSKAMQGLNLAYAMFYRKRYQYRGHLWHSRFSSVLIDDAHALLECGGYVELTPVRAGLADQPQAYPWSSYHHHAGAEHYPLLTPSPSYQDLSDKPIGRQAAYRRLIEEELKQEEACSFPHELLEPFTHVEGPHGFPVVQQRRGRPRKREVSIYE